LIDYVAEMPVAAGGLLLQAAKKVKAREYYFVFGT